MALNLQYHPNLRLGESILQQDIDLLKRKLKRKPLFANCYLITMSNNAYDQLEFYSSAQLCQKFYRKNPPYVVGIAGDREEAMDIVEALVKECYEQQKNCELKEFLKC